MDSHSLTPEQCCKIMEHTGRTVRYLANMRRRMNHRLWPEDDKVLVLTAKAYQAMLELHTEVRCLANQPRRR